MYVLKICTIIYLDTFFYCLTFYYLTFYYLTFNLFLLIFLISYFLTLCFLFISVISHIFRCLNPYKRLGDKRLRDNRVCDFLIVYGVIFLVRDFIINSGFLESDLESLCSRKRFFVNS